LYRIYQLRGDLPNPIQQPNCTLALITIDGEPTAMLDQYVAGWGMVDTWTSSALPPGIHTIHIQVSTMNVTRTCLDWYVVKSARRERDCPL
jgi:hypothetical protein